MQNFSFIQRATTTLGSLSLLALLCAPGAAMAQDQDLNDSRNKPPCATPASVTLDYVEYDVIELVKYMAETSCRNLILGGDELKGKVTIISHKPVPYWTAFAAMESALATAGYTMVDVGGTYKVIPTSKASQAPVAVYEGTSIPATDRVITQIFELENVPVSDISSIAKELAGPQAKIIAYVPTNTLIITDSAYNIRRMWKVVGQLDVASPKSEIHIVQIRYATASEVKTIIEQVYGTETASSSSSSSSSKSTSASTKRRNRRNRDKTNTTSTASASNVGSQGKYIEKIVADERTNRLIILANAEAMAAVQELIDEVDVDVDPSNRAQIHVVYLEHAKAEDVATTLSALSQNSSSSSSSRSSRTPSRTQTSRSGRTIPQPDSANGGAKNGTTNVTALLDDGVRITADENTNSLVIVASPEAFEILQQVISKLDIRRKQVFVEVVIMEVATEDTMDVGLSYHTALPGDNTALISSQLGGSSLGLSTDLLSGVAMGVYGDSIPVTVDGVDFDLPAFGIVVNALQANGSVNILSTPSIMTLDNEEAEIVVGRNVPFPTSQGRDSNNNPIISFQREDVAITLRVTPQINESDYVTMEIYQEVTEIEESAASSGDLTASGGPTTSKRTAETTVLVKDNQTVVIGGLMSSTETEVEIKVPLLGDLPLVGVFFRSKKTTTRKTNLLIFLTPHVVDSPEDLAEVYRVKMAQREEFLRRFYGKSEVEQAAALNELLSYSMNIIDEPSRYRGPEALAGDPGPNVTTIGVIPEEEPELLTSPEELLDPAELVDPQGLPTTPEDE